MRVFITLYIALIVSSTGLFAQVADSVKTDSVKVTSPNTEAKNDSVLASQTKEPLEESYPVFFREVNYRQSFALEYLSELGRFLRLSK